MSSSETNLTCGSVLHKARCGKSDSLAVMPAVQHVCTNKHWACDIRQLKVTFHCKIITANSFDRIRFDSIDQLPTSCCLQPCFIFVYFLYRFDHL